MVQHTNHPRGNPRANIKSISHRCYLFEVAFVWELAKETIVLPLGCLQGGCGCNPASPYRVASRPSISHVARFASAGLQKRNCSLCGENILDPRTRLGGRAGEAEEAYARALAPARERVLY